MPRLVPQIGDIWKFDTTSLYAGGGYARLEHWLILDAGPSNFISMDYDGYQSTRFDKMPASRDFAVLYLHLETGRNEVKVFYSREWSSQLDLTGNPYYKKVA